MQSQFEQNIYEYLETHGVIDPDNIPDLAFLLLQDVPEEVNVTAKHTSVEEE